MNFSEYNNLLKYIFISIAVIIVISFLFISNRLVEDLSKEERQKIELWAEATREMALVEDGTDTDFMFKIISSNTTIPVILCDSANNILFHSNLKPEYENDSILLSKELQRFKSHHAPIIIKDALFTQYVYYDDSYILKRLQIYPYVQIGVLTVFILISFLALLSTKKAEQNKVWVGLSKETAHQLGTPISSLMAWTEYLKTKGVDLSITQEMEKDVTRLQIVADRFSKIGAAPPPERMEIRKIVSSSVGYLENRISKKVQFFFDFTHNEVYALINESLFSWVIENLTKNAVDAMEGKGKITYVISDTSSCIYLDITDTGKGIPKSKFKTIFSPGYTTKTRGWGLGLSLTKRIIESYYKGRIYVKSSELGVGTTFRIELKKVN